MVKVFRFKTSISSHLKSDGMLLLQLLLEAGFNPGACELWGTQRPSEPCEGKAELLPPGHTA